MKLWVARAEWSLFDPIGNTKQAAFCWYLARFVAARRADLAGVVPPAAAFPEHQAGVLGAFSVGCGNRMPPAVRAVNFIARTKCRILDREISQPHRPIVRLALDRGGQRPRFDLHHGLLAMIGMA
jgi:hypothetical protein